MVIHARMERRVKHHLLTALQSLRRATLEALSTLALEIATDLASEPAAKTQPTPDPTVYKTAGAFTQRNAAEQLRRLADRIESGDLVSAHVEFRWRGTPWIAVTEETYSDRPMGDA